MARKAVSVTLDEANLVWLRGRAHATASGNVSAVLDRLVTSARTGGDELRPVRSVVGTVTLPTDDPDFSKAKAAIRALFEESLSRPLFAREADTPYRAPSSPRPAARRRRRG